MIQSTASFIFAKRKGLERLNAARTSAAGDGSTEPNLYFAPQEQNANESLPVCQTEQIRTLHQLVKGSDLLFIFEEKIRGIKNTDGKTNR